VALAVIVVDVDVVVVVVHTNARRGFEIEDSLLRRRNASD